ncbi:VanZ family protein [Bacillus sp. JJ1122]|uniref:VanZ family protein n=1 Tax=Bacillus sp. JJ1122 TaxID=3122951 RepID=UPI002FFF063B
MGRRLIKKAVRINLLLKRLFFISITLFYMCFIWLQSSHFDPESLSPISSSINKTVYLLIGASLEFAHLFLFGILYLCIILVFLSFGTLRRWQEVIAVIIALSYGVVDEIHQLYVPFRSFSVIDLLKDAIGVFAFWWVINRSYFYKQNSRIGQWLSSMNKVTR